MHRRRASSWPHVREGMSYFGGRWQNSRRTQSEAWVWGFGEKCGIVWDCGQSFPSKGTLPLKTPRVSSSYGCQQQPSKNGIKMMGAEAGVILLCLLSQPLHRSPHASAFVFLLILSSTSTGLCILYLTSLLPSLRHPFCATRAQAFTFHLHSQHWFGFTVLRLSVRVIF